MEMNHKKFASVFMTVLFLSGLFSTVAFAASPADFQFGIGSDSIADTPKYIYYLVLDSFGVCNIVGTGKGYDSSLSWTDAYTTADTAEERCAGFGLRGGNFLFYILLPLLLAYFMFFAIMQKTNIFEIKTARNMSIVLSLLMVPLGIFRIIFINLMSVLTGTTIILLYVFLFVLMLGWAYKNMYAKGMKDVHQGSMHVTMSKRAADHVKNIETKIKEANTEIKDLEIKMQENEMEQAQIQIIDGDLSFDMDVKRKAKGKLIEQKAQMQKRHDELFETQREYHKIHNGATAMINKHLQDASHPQ